MIVVLTPEELAVARDAGAKRLALYIARSMGGFKAGHQKRGTCNALGAVAEYALAKHYGPDVLNDWINTKAFGLEHWKIPCDVGVNLHVRATDRPNGGLIVHPYDPDNGAFVLAICDPSGTGVRFVGWALGKALKDTDFWRDKGPGFGRPGCAAFCAPQSVLNPMDSLPKEYVR